MPKKKVEEKQTKVKKVKEKKEKIQKVVETGEIKGEYSIRTVDTDGRIHFEINWNDLKNHIQMALTTVEKPAKLV